MDLQVLYFYDYFRYACLQRVTQTFAQICTSEFSGSHEHRRIFTTSFPRGNLYTTLVLIVFKTFYNRRSLKSFYSSPTCLTFKLLSFSESRNKVCKMKMDFTNPFIIKLMQPLISNENYYLPFGQPIVRGLILQYSVTFMPALHAKHSAICA